ncbi:MAG TPA: hypothetical protein VME70_15810 [Mycobacteriales bacterium]|nr:hypothetical protein [Mycobacteriales bacterium]
MAKSARIAITLLSCVSLSVLGTAGVASAHPKHAKPVIVKVHKATTGHRMHSNGDAWCC